MPCDTVNRISIDFGKADPALLKAAMDKLYPGVNYTLRNGKLTYTDYGANVSESAVRKEMSRQTLTAQAKRFGWAVKEQPNGQLLLQKGRL